ncbi:hypothetical protein V3C99_010433 [Haemonchus contortus]
MIPYIFVLCMLLGIAQAQLFLGFSPSLPFFKQQPFQFSQNVAPWQPEMVPTQAPIERIENMPNPDLEPGVWAIPDPESWPIGPDWNDPRNTWKGIEGWTSSKKFTITENRSQ